MTTEELAELFMVSLYDMAEAAPHPYFLFTMNDFAPRMGITDMADVRRALRFLEERGLIFLASTDAWGGISAGITVDGSQFVENGGETGIIARYRKDPTSLIAETRPAAPELLQDVQLERAPEATQPAPSSQPPSGDALQAVLAEMAEVLRQEAGLEPLRREDLLSDVQTLKIQTGKRSANRAVVMGLLEGLSEVPSILPLVRLFVRLLEGKT